MSKNITLAENFSRDAVHHAFAPKVGDITVGNTQPYGSATISSLALGVKYPNVQSAVDDLAALYTASIGAVHISEDGSNPAGSSQVDEFKFTGRIVDPTKLAGAPLNFSFYGFNVVVAVGDTGEEVAAKVKLILDQATTSNFIINNVNFGGTLDTLQIKYNDNQQHVLPQLLQLGVGIKQTTISPAKFGYGVWTRIGTQTLTLDGATAPVTLYYFKREA